MRDYSWDLDKPNRLLSELCAELDIPLLQLEPIFRERLRETGEALHWQYDGHWNQAGIRIAAELMADFILERFEPRGSSGTQGTPEGGPQTRSRIEPGAGAGAVQPSPSFVLLREFP
jgi:hypothetical protein